MTASLNKLFTRVRIFDYTVSLVGGSPSFRANRVRYVCLPEPGQALRGHTQCDKVQCLNDDSVLFMACSSLNRTFRFAR